jgi:hypothetical protein
MTRITALSVAIAAGATAQALDDDTKIDPAHGFTIKGWAIAEIAEKSRGAAPFCRHSWMI